MSTWCLLIIFLKPQYSAFYSYLRNENTLESDHKNFVDKGAEPTNPNRPKKGGENYELIKQV